MNCFGGASKQPSKDTGERHQCKGNRRASASGLRVLLQLIQSNAPKGDLSFALVCVPLVRPGFVK